MAQLSFGAVRVGYVRRSYNNDWYFCISVTRIYCMGMRFLHLSLSLNLCVFVGEPEFPAKLTWSLTPYHISMCLSEQYFPANTNLGLEDLLCHSQEHM